MNEKEILKIKSSKPFKKLDLIIYFLVFAIIFALFLSFVILPNSEDSLGFCVKLNNKTVVTVKYGQSIVVEEEFKGYVIVTSDTILIYANEEKTKYNKLQFNSEEKSVMVIQSSCPSKDCSKIVLSDNRRVIICAPNNLIISSLSKSGPNLPITGWLWKIN